MGSELLHKLGKKKGGCHLLLQNTTKFDLIVLNPSLKGKEEKNAPFPSVIAPVSAVEVGLYAPEGQWTFAVQGEPNVKTRLTILFSAEHANLERLPTTAAWTADLQQNWKPDVKQIVVTFTPQVVISKLVSNASSTPPGSSSRDELHGSGSGKVKKPRTPKDTVDSLKKDKDEFSDSEQGTKKKRGRARAGSTSSPHEDHGSVATSASTSSITSHSYPNPPSRLQESDSHGQNTPPSSAFGIDAELGRRSDDSDDSDGGSRSSSGWGRRFNVVINPQAMGAQPSSPGSDDLNELRQASSRITLNLGQSNSRTSVAPPSAIPSHVSGSPQKARPSSPRAAEDDFFKEMDSSRKSSNRHLSMPSAEREKRLSQIPPAAQTEFDKALVLLNQGKVAESSASVHAALSQLNDLAFKNNVAVATRWCVYAQLTGILAEMKRLEAAQLYAQRALLARFLGMLSVRLENQEHTLLCLRMAVNLNLEMENYRTAAQLLQSMVTLPYLTEKDKQNVPKKQELCASHSYSEAHVPKDAILDPKSGQFLLNGYSYALCHRTLLLIRDVTFYVCPYCQASFSEKAVPDSKCTFCGTTLHAHN